MDKKKNRIVVKVGTSTIAHPSGNLNFRHLEKLCKVLSDLQNSGKEVILVTSGAIAVGLGRLGLKTRPEETSKKQALAAVGQCELMFMYDKFFTEYNQTVAQVLLTADVIDNEKGRTNVQNTFKELIEMGIIPIVNENDTVATDELEGKNFGDNDTLSALVGKLSDADLLVIITDIDGLYDKDPRTNEDAQRINYVPVIDDHIVSLAGGAGSRLGTGGMATKIEAAKISTKAGIPCCIISGKDPANLYDLFDGKEIGTTFGIER
ncbi:glutamate 5-kinase [Clostridiales Family XIII bacterium PM5-7]